MTAPSPRPSVMNIQPYQGGHSQLDGVENAAKLSANEGALGPSPKAQEAYIAVATGQHRYPDGGSYELRSALAERHDLNVDRIVCGCGSDELIGLLISAYAGEGDEVVYSQYGFAMYPIYAHGAGATPVEAPANGLATDVDALLAAVTDKTKLVFIANPNNPTGTMMPKDEVARLRAGLRDDIILVIDAAYAEFVTDDSYTCGIDLVDASQANGTQNTVMTRTFSKIYGLGGMRVGWCYAPEAIADVLNRVRSPFNVNAAAQAAAAAAVRDVAFFNTCVAHNETWRPWLTEEVRKLGIEVTDSYGNFILVHFPDGTVQQAQEALAGQAVIVRPVASYGLPNALRITIGTEDENKRIVAGLTEYAQTHLNKG